MKKLSIVGEIINSEDISILDENNIPVSIYQKSQYKFNYNLFAKPYIIVDTFEKRKYKDIEIKVIDLEYLKKFSYRLISIKCNSRIKNFPRQSQSYMLESTMKPIPNSIILTKVPKDHFIELDITNNRIRIKGKNGYPYNRGTNSTPWITIIKK